MDPTLALPSRFPSSFLIPLLLIAALAGCEKKEQRAATPQAVEVKALRVVARDVPVSFEFVAQTQSSQQVNINARVSGFLDKRVYQEGAMVKEGDVLFLMDKKPFEAQLSAAKAALAQEEAAHATALANLKRVKPLVELNALSQKDLDDATGQEQRTAAGVEQAKANVESAALNLSYCTITSPVTGITGAAQQQDGTYLSPQNSFLTTVAVLSPMWVNFSVSENEMQNYREEVTKGLLKVPPDRGYEVELIMVDGSLFPQTGRITFADPSYSSQTGTFLIRASIANPNAVLRPNQYVRARLKGAIRPNAILVPQRAVQQGAKGHFVWVVNSAGKAELRPVIVGDWYGDNWFISQGLAAGEQVVIDGGLRLGPDAPVKATQYTPPPGAAETPPPTPPPGASLVVHFEKRKATLDAEALRMLKTIIPAIKAGPNPVDVTGYADRTGSHAANVDLAKRRAAAVRDALIAEGVPADRIRLKAPRDVTGAGSDDEARRVELSVGR